MISMLIGKYKVFVCLCVFALDHSRPYTYASTYRSVFVCAYGCVELCVCVIMSSRRRIGVYLHTYMFRHTFGSMRVCVLLEALAPVGLSGVQISVFLFLHTFRQRLCYFYLLKTHKMA